MTFQDEVSKKLQALSGTIQFVNGYVLSTRNPEWSQVDAGYAIAIAQYMKMRQRIIDLATTLPTV